MQDNKTRMEEPRQYSARGADEDITFARLSAAGGMRPGALERMAASPPLGGILVVLAALSMLGTLYLTNSSWFYTPQGWLDSWIPIGIGLHYGDPSFANDSYKISRLTWNLLQFVTRAVFLENAGQIVLHFFLFGLQSLLVWLGFIRLFSATTAVVVAVFASAFPLILTSTWIGGSDYQNALSSPLFFAVMASIAVFNGRNTSVAGALFGASLVSLIITNSNYLNMSPFILGVAVVRFLDQVGGGGGVASFIRLLVWTILGAVGVILALGLINIMAGREFLFFMPEVRYILMMLRDSSLDGWWLPITADSLKNVVSFGAFAGWGIVALVESLSILKARSVRAERMAIAIHVLFLFELLVWTLWQVAGHHTALLPTYFAYPLYGPMMMSMAAMLHRRLGDRGPLAFYAALLLLPPLFVIGLTNSGWLQALALPVLQARSAFVAITILAIYLVILVPKRRSQAFAGLLLLLPLMSAAAAEPKRFAPTSCTFGASLNRFLVSSARYVTRLVPKPTDVFVWAPEAGLQDMPENCRDFGPVVVHNIGYSFAMLGPSFIDQPWPTLKPVDQLPLDRLRSIARKDTLFALVSNDHTDALKLIERFKEAGVEVEDAGRIMPEYGLPLPTIFLLRPSNRSGQN